MSTLGYNKRSKGGTIYLFPEEDFVLSNKDDGAIIRINADLKCTIPLNLKPEFYCKIQVFLGFTLRVDYELGVNVDAPEGFFVEGGQTIVISGNGLADQQNSFEVMRQRPIDNTWTKILSATKLYYPGNDRGIPMGTLDGKIRLMREAELLFESPNEYPPNTDLNWETLNPNEELVDIYFSTNKLNSWSGSIIEAQKLYLENLDFSELPVNFNFNIERSNYVSGITNLPNTFYLTFDKCDFGVILHILTNCDITRLYDGNTVNDWQEDLFIKDKPNLQRIECANLVSNYHVGYHIKNNPELTHFDMYNNTALNSCNNLVVENCPKLNFFKFRNFWKEGGNKNIDQILIDLDNNGVQNGTWWTSEDFVFTTTSDKARTNLLNKGWSLKFTRD